MSHVALLIPTLDRIGGAERQVLLLAQALAARNWRVTLIALSGSASLPPHIPETTGIAYLSLNMRKAWIDPAGWSRYLHWHRANHPDVLHAHLPHATWFARCVRLFAPVPVLVDTIHTSATGGMLRRLAYRATDLLTTRVTCVSQTVAETIFAHRMASPAHLSVVHNGVVLSAPPDPINQSTSGIFRWIAIGRLAPVKDYPTLLRAFADLPPHAQLTILGTGPDEDTMRYQALTLGIAARIHFAGFIADIQPFLAQADAFVLASLWEGLPVSILEAQAASLPVVATNAAGTRETMLDGCTGHIVPVGDSTALAAAMARIMNMFPADRAAMGARGRQLVLEQFEIGIIAETWDRLYRTLLESHPRRKQSVLSS